LGRRTFSELARAPRFRADLQPPSLPYGRPPHTAVPVRPSSGGIGLADELQQFSVRFNLCSAHSFVLVSRHVDGPSGRGAQQERKALGQHFFHFFARALAQRARQRSAIQVGGPTWVAGLPVAGRRADAMHRGFQGLAEGIEQRGDPLFIRGRRRPKRLGRFPAGPSSLAPGPSRARPIFEPATLRLVGRTS